LATEQYGFRKGLSTKHATVLLTDNILTAWKRKIHIGGIFCDLAKAFDCVNHDILIKNYNIMGYMNQSLTGLNRTYLVGGKEQN
jgi:hypothetical protein